MPQVHAERRSGDDAVESILGVEVVAHVRDKLVVGRMVERLDADDLRRERMVVLVHVAKEVELSRGRTDHKDLLCVLQRECDLMEELFASRMPTLLMRFACDVMVRRLHLRDVEALGLDVKDLGLNVINPNRCVANSHRLLHF